LDLAFHSARGGPDRSLTDRDRNRAAPRSLVWLRDLLDVKVRNRLASRAVGAEDSLHDATGSAPGKRPASFERASTKGIMAKRTTHRSSAGKKLYAVRDESGQFKDIQSYARAHRADMAQKSMAEIAAAKKAAKKKPARKVAKKKVTKKKAAKKAPSKKK